MLLDFFFAISEMIKFQKYDERAWINKSKHKYAAESEEIMRLINQPFGMNLKFSHMKEFSIHGKTVYTKICFDRQ